MRGFPTRTRRFSTPPRTACTGQSIDGEVVARAEPAVADAEPGFRGTRSSPERKALTIHPRRCRSDTIMAESYRNSPKLLELCGKSFIL